MLKPRKLEESVRIIIKYVEKKKSVDPKRLVAVAARGLCPYYVVCKEDFIQSVLWSLIGDDLLTIDKVTKKIILGKNRLV